MRELQAASQLGARVVKRRLNGQITTEPDPSDFASRFRHCCDAVTRFACGHTYLSKALDIWVEPSFQL